MGRPPLPVGTFGKIRIYPLGPKRFRARTQFRDHDGEVRDVERVGTSASNAEANLKEALRDRGRVANAQEITPDTRIVDLGERYLTEFQKAVDRGKKSPTTVQLYRYYFDRYIKKGVGQLTIREAKVSRLDRLVADVQEHHGTAAARTTRTVLSGMMGLAARYDALDRNPVREVGRIEGENSSARSLTLQEAVDLRAKIHASSKAREWDLIDFTDFMLATGLRIGEASAVTVEALDLDAATVEVRGTVVRITGQGLVIKPRPKGKRYRTLELPTWMVDRLRVRPRPTNRWGAVFTAPLGGLRDPSNTQADLRVIFDEAGYEWVTSHVYRKTVATLMDGAGLTARQAADQLGHAKVSMTQDRYFGRGVAKTGAAEVLEVFGTSEPVATKTGGKLGDGGRLP